MSEPMDWHKRATAVSTALYAEGDRRRLGAYSGFLYGVDSALTWASEQEPTDEEVEAAAYEIYRRSYRMTWVSWDRLRPYVKTPFRSAGRAALLAAQKVRAGQ